MKRLSITFLNFGVILAMMMALNHNPQENFADLIKKSQAETSNIAEESHPAANPATSTDLKYASQLGKLNLTLRAQVEDNFDVSDTNQELNHCKSLVYRTLKSLPAEPVNKLKNLTLVFSDTARRGLGGVSTILLRCQGVTDQELVGVLTHEMGHIEDTGVLSGTANAGKSSFKDGSLPIYKDDQSLAFYTISFENEKTLKKDALEQDFVSGYAMSDPFEDFAETYAFYVLHGDEFRKLIDDNRALSRKYYYLKYFVFEGKEYKNGDINFDGNKLYRNYDVTVLSFSLDKFFTV